MMQFFDHIFILNLPRRPDRALWTQEHCSRLGLQAELFRGIDAAFLSDIRSRIGFPAQLGNFGATLSHLDIFQTALARGYQRVLVLEDDLVFHREAPRIFTSLERQIPTDWEMLYLAWIPVDEVKDEWDYNLIRDRFISPNIIRADRLWSAMAYGIRDTLMRDILSSYKSSFTKEIDRYFVEDVQPIRKVYATWPQLFAGKDGWSDCGGIDLQVFRRSHDTRISKDDDYF